jgi:glycosyltransferase involved in cell wall biosynthesis
VDGSIENEDFAMVVVSRSVPYFDEVSTQSLSNVFVLDAVVVVDDGQYSDTLQLVFDPQAFPPVFYRGANPLLKGISGKSYNLTVIADGKTLTARTSIPTPIPLDSLYWKPDAANDALGFGWGHFKDPDTIGNIYRIFVKRQGYPFYATIRRSTSDDRIYNGLSTEFSFFRPDSVPSFLLSDEARESEDRFYFKRGDTIYMKWATLDRISYEFVNTYEIAATSFRNPFAAPTFIRSNIQGAGGLGGWVGYGVSFHLYVVPK